MRVMRLCSSSGSERLCHCPSRTALNMDNRGIGGTAAVVSKVTGSFDDLGTVRSVANQSPDPTSIVGSGRCVWQS